MENAGTAQRRWLIWAAALVCAAFPVVAPALEPSRGAVILSVSGALTQTNDGSAASFDLALLQTLPTTSFTTKTPWYSTPRKFSGVLVRDLLDAVGARGATMVQAVGLNDYRAEMPVEDLVANGALIAWLLDDQPMLVRDKGPLVIIFPFSDRPALRTALHYGRAVWQLRRLELR